MAYQAHELPTFMAEAPLSDKNESHKDSDDQSIGIASSKSFPIQVRSRDSSISRISKRSARHRFPTRPEREVVETTGDEFDHSEGPTQGLTNAINDLAKLIRYSLRPETARDAARTQRALALSKTLAKAS